jgi:hypothetical protein
MPPTRHRVDTTEAPASIQRHINPQEKRYHHMTLSMHDLSVPLLARMLGNLSAILDKAAAHCAAKKIDPSVLAGSRLYPDMFNFTRQVQLATDFAKGCGARLAGLEVPKFEDNEATLDQLKARIDKTLAFLGSLRPEQFSGAEQREIVLRFGDREIRFDGRDYLLKAVYPNFFFHVTTAYDILRHCGVELGKSDFVGALDFRPVQS